MKAAQNKYTALKRVQIKKIHKNKEQKQTKKIKNKRKKISVHTIRGV